MDQQIIFKNLYFYLLIWDHNNLNIKFPINNSFYHLKIHPILSLNDSKISI